MIFFNLRYDYNEMKKYRMSILKLGGYDISNKVKIIKTLKEFLGAV